MNVKFTLAGATLAALLAGTAAQAQDVIGYITKSATNAGWMMINQGAADAAEEEGVKLVSVGPSFQGDLSSQLEVFENLVAQGAKAIGVAPVDSSGIAPAVNDAMSAGIPIIAIDTGVSGAEVTSFVATDNYAVAKEQGNAAAALVADGDAVIYVTGNQAQSTGQERRNGFVEAFSAARPNSEIVEVPTEWDSAQAQEGVEAILNARDDIKMVVNAWDGGTMGAKAALENLGYGAGDVKLVGFDGASDAIVAMDEGWVHADTAQMLYQMGYQGIKAAAAAARGEEVSPRIDTGYFLVTPETSAEYKKMIGME
ncbi:sugar ABC transporter substrate-binding protein [Pseudooceanicola nitratireducens]|jgi:ribose transport system substrate-binding protein|uniref:Monosaccharide ABC transporter substrate-binding protein, CUT2 family n=1 Tax=Pseudooceanicola nitratireducens TaxID=517719 RepID=A0A1I1J1W2_9RHOB|nr:sugar ABC transporter substrate-binding protein [Pseudooceanicola nitratireducens]MEC7297902.1 sugar ABC transporter substrate-binding protein [Pseudomonadota bacterium]MBY6158903.1 sugar ABC transporter substrate-binding protein [Pseudooceanicola nitratireducens]MBY6164900.1 sugar ABC transporter substrate-binding protein [Pseudooceanicola nitratireducens]MEC7794793.1 sugar ABC transporter substrate-binding protein [Pseudomonadota bacterium]MEC9102330.1 sugar ABC transporter substrate-bind|eukprot:g17471.t1